MAERESEIARQNKSGLTRRDPFLEESFHAMDRFANEMDRVFEDVFGRRLSPRMGRSWPRSPWRSELEQWAPEIEVFHRNHELVIRADLPGLTRNDIKVDVTENRITIQGERKREHEEETAGVYRSERSYGSFYREIQVPEGSITDQAKANFTNGVLEITMPAPPEQVRQGRRLEIAESAKK